MDDCFYLFSDPLGNKIVAKDDYGRTSNKPESIETEERVIETTLKKKEMIFELKNLKLSPSLDNVSG